MRLDLGVLLKIVLRFLTCGESHGPALIAILDGMPAGLPINLASINEELSRRQQGYGRGNRQKIEKDTAEIMGGVRHGITTGAPLALLIRNRDYDNWRHVMSVEPVDLTNLSVDEQLTKKAIKGFRPGHADLAGTFKFRQNDIRDVLERASARETAARVAAGACAEQLLSYLNIQVTSHVLQVGSVKAPQISFDMKLSELEKRVAQSPMFCVDAEATAKFIELIKEEWQAGDSIGGVVEVLSDGLPIGLGSYTQWDKKLDGRLAQAIMSIQAMKAVEIGDGVANAFQPGSLVHDALYANDQPEELPFKRKTNRAGGIEGGMTNGERLCLRAYMKPIPTLRNGLESVSFPQFANQSAHYERSDVCAIAAASVVCKAMVCITLATAVLEKFGGDNVKDLKKSFDEYQSFCRSRSFSSTQSLHNKTIFNAAEDSEKIFQEPQGNEDAVGEF